MSYSLPHVKITIVKGRNLVAKDSGNSSDPYCKLRIVDEKEEQLGSELVTQVIEKNRLNPEWNEEFSDWKFKADQTSRVGGSSIVIEMWDKDRFTKDDFMGMCTIKLSELEQDKPKLMWLELNSRPNKRDEVSGDIRVIVYWKDIDKAIQDSVKILSGE